MFLNELNRNESIGFINLVSKLAEIDNEFAEEEKELISDYKKELNLENDDIESRTLNEVLESISTSDDRIKKIIYFELIGLALIDGEYEEKEIEFLNIIAEEFKISRANRISFANYFYRFTDVYNFTTVESENKIELLKEQAEELLK